MKKILNITPLSIEELNQWKNNPLINPKTKKKIKENSRTYNLLKKSYDSYISNISNESIILKCNEDRDLISLNLFWTEKDKIKKIVYPKDQLDQLIFYTDNNNKVRGFEKESLKYMKTYNITNHPISNEPIPKDILAQVDIFDLKEINKNKTIEHIALDVFQYFTKISIFIDHTLFLKLNKNQLLTFNYELSDLWLNNFNSSQKENISKNKILNKPNKILIKDNLKNIQKYLLNQMEILLQCNIKEYKYMINYVILGALGIVINIDPNYHPQLDLN